MFMLAGLALVVPGESISTVAIIAPLSSGGVLIVLGNLFFLNRGIQVVTQVAEDVEYSQSMAAEATGEAIS